MKLNNQRFPKNPKDNDEISDKYGNLWKFDLERDSWLSMGTISNPPIVTEEQDGLVTPEIFDKIKKIKALLDSDFNLSPFKILPGKDAYWYYFKASNKLFRFTPEAENVLRIEIDKGRFYNIIYREICPGSKGNRGIRGEQGNNGTPGPVELCYVPITTGKILDFAIYTPTPLTLNGPINLPNKHVPDVSVRIAQLTALTEIQSLEDTSKEQLQHLAIHFHPFKEIAIDFQQTRNILSQQSLNKQELNLCDFPLSKVLIDPENYTVADPIVEILIDPTETIAPRIISNLNIDLEKSIPTIKLDPITNIVCGSIFLINSNWEGLWCVKSRQKGPDGIKGENGNCYPKIIECTVDNSNIIATCPIINTRLDCDQGVIYTLCSDILDEICANQITLLPNSDTLTNTTPLKSIYASAQMTLDNCKSINRYQFNLPQDQITDLNLEHWEPQAGCVTQRNYNRFKFDWISNTDIPACDEIATWFSPTGVRAGKFPWSFQLANAPTDPDPCCQEPAFFCPNIQDGGCGDGGGGGGGGPSPSALAAGNASSIHSMKINNNKKFKSIVRGAKEWEIRV